MINRRDDPIVQPLFTAVFDHLANIPVGGQRGIWDENHSRPFQTGNMGKILDPPLHLNPVDEGPPFERVIVQEAHRDIG
jgi:hypothetical protein